VECGVVECVECVVLCCVECVECVVLCGVWRVVCSVECGVWSVECGVWRVVWSVECSVELGLVTPEHHQDLKELFLFSWRQRKPATCHERCNITHQIILYNILLLY
jgi:hypothetical protein